MYLLKRMSETVNFNAKVKFRQFKVRPELIGGTHCSKNRVKFKFSKERFNSNAAGNFFLFRRGARSLSLLVVEREEEKAVGDLTQFWRVVCKLN